MVAHVVRNYYKGKSNEPIKLDSNVDLRQWSREQQVLPSRMKTKGVAIRKTSSMMDSKQYATEANSRRERKSAQSTAVLSRRMSTDGTRGCRSVVGIVSGQPVSSMRSIDQSRNAAWLSSSPKAKGVGTSALQHAPTGRAKNPFLSSMGSSPDEFLNGCLGDTERSVAEPNATSNGNEIKVELGAAPQIYGGDKGEKRTTHKKVALLQRSLQVMLPRRPFRATKSKSLDHRPVAQMSDSELAQIIINDDIKWFQFKRSLQERRTGSDNRAFTHARLQHHELAQILRESASAPEVGCSSVASSPQLAALARGKCMMRNIEGHSVTFGAEHVSGDHGQPRQVKRFAPRSKSSPARDATVETQWTVVPRRKRLISRTGLFSSNRNNS